MLRNGVSIARGYKLMSDRFRFAAWSQWVVILCPILLWGPAQGAVLLSEVLDPVGDGSPAYCDIVAARVWQTDVSHYQVEIEVAGEFQEYPTGGDHIRFLWYLDTDENKDTGQSHGSVGSELNVRCRHTDDPTQPHGGIDPLGAAFGIAKGGAVTKFISGRKAVVLVPFERIANLTRFNWRCEILTQPGGLRDQVTNAVLVPGPTNCFGPSTPTRLVVEDTISFIGGITSAVPVIYCQNAAGDPLRVGPSAVIEYHPYLPRVGISNGALRAIPGEFRSCPVAVSVDGRLCESRVNVVPGHLEVEPFIVHLDASGHGATNATLTLRARDAFDNPVDPTGHQLTWITKWPPNQPTITTTATPGIIVVAPASSTATGKWYLMPSLDGETERGSAIVRVVSTNYALGTPHVYDTPWASFGLPGDLSLSLTGETIDEMMASRQVAQVAEAAIPFQRAMIGQGGCGGDRQLYAGVVNDADGGNYALSGNPVTLEFKQGVSSQSIIRNYFTGEPWWRVYFHESTHNCLGSRVKAALDGSAVGDTMGEALANVCSIYLIRELIARASPLSLAPTTVASLQGAFDEKHDDDLAALATYESHPAETNLDANNVGGMLISFCDARGWWRLPRFFSIMLSDTDFFTFDTRTNNTTFVAACWAAAFETNSLPLCRDRWQWPIDEAYYYALLPELTRLARLRDVPPWRLDVKGTQDGQAVLSWNSRPHEISTLTTSPDLRAPTWTPVMSVTGQTYQAIIVTNLVPASAAFYRIEGSAEGVLPPDW
ncbi:MAG TPA: hypothetical protein P5205_20755 [Candidatus Paceibacterota bacterium]|nr:hypothetical protein [Verrucomicrobiota bacterium]HSA12795.1 hypothetical protein [Candidatus Paceibacterota bacterium]